MLNCAHRTFYAGLAPCGGTCEAVPPRFEAFTSTNITIMSNISSIPRGTRCGCRWSANNKPLVSTGWRASEEEPSNEELRLPLCAESNLPPDWKCGESRDHSFLRKFCSDAEQIDDPDRCVEGIKTHFRRPVTNQKVFWLFGDSHAVTVAPGLARAISPHRLFYAQSGVATFMTDQNDPLAECTEQLLRSLEGPQGLRSGDVVGVLYFAGRGCCGRSQLEKNLRRIQSLAGRRNAQIVLFGDWPELPHGGPLCWPMRGGLRTGSEFYSLSPFYACSRIFTQRG